MSKYLAYPAYKASEVESIGDIPEHWEMKRLKFVFILQRGHDLSTDKMKGGEYAVCASNGVIGWHDEYTSIAPSVTVGRSGSVGEVNYIEQNFWAHNTALYIKQFFDCVPRYSYYLLLVLDLKSLSFGSAVGSLNRNYIHDLKIPISSFNEQQQIADFLDDKTAHIDKLIEQKQQMIELLNEKRIALITQAVTKGLDLTIPMKDSGVEWLGNVPEHWEVRKLKFSVDLISSKVNARDSNLSFIGLENIESFTGKIITSDSEFESDGVSLYHDVGDVLFCKLRPYLAKVYLANKAGLCTSELLVLRGTEIMPSFLKYYLLSQEFINIVDSSTYGSKMPRANWEFIGNLPCLIPCEEQQQIANHLDTETQKIDDMIKTVKLAITTLQEYRTALITAAVTGKIDVRDFKIPINKI